MSNYVYDQHNREFILDDDHYSERSILKSSFTEDDFSEDHRSSNISENLFNNNFTNNDFIKY